MYPRNSKILILGLRIRRRSTWFQINFVVTKEFRVMYIADSSLIESLKVDFFKSGRTDHQPRKSLTPFQSLHI